MSVLISITMLPMALAGYGDVDDEGFPNYEERGVHLWTNAVRVDPEAFDAEYQSSGCTFADFEPSEQTPKQLLYFDRNLNIAGRFHSQDMYDNNWFEHESSDGTSFFDRVARYYTESSYVGENIAAGYPSPYSSVMHGWMCSAGHRSNIMLADYNELGTGVISAYYTQDFAAGNADSDGPVAMGIHDDVSSAGEATFYVDWQDEAAPDSVKIVIDGFGTELILEWGEDTLGIFSGRVTPEDTEVGCHEYYFAWTTQSGISGTFPEEGSYLYGSDCDNDLMWIGTQTGGGALLQQDPSFDPQDDLKLIGCATQGWNLDAKGNRISFGSIMLLSIVPLVLLLRRRDQSHL